MTRTLKLSLVVVMALTLSACGAAAGDKQTGTPAASQAKAAVRTTNVGRTSHGSGGARVPNFTITTLSGKRFDLKDERGKVVALYFMAGWCGSCIPEARSWSKLYPAYKSKGLDLLIISVDPSDTARTIAKFREAGNIPQLPWAIDKTSKVSRLLHIQALDSTIIIGRDGRIVYRDSAPTPYYTLESRLKEAL